MLKKLTAEEAWDVLEHGGKIQGDGWDDDDYFYKDEYGVISKDNMFSTNISSASDLAQWECDWLLYKSPSSVIKINRRVVQILNGEVEVFGREADGVIFLGTEEQEDYACLTIEQARELSVALNDLAADVAEKEIKDD